jgi:hypothetical protein
MAKEKKMEHTKENLALLLDRLSSEERLLADREENKGRLGSACDHLAKSNAYLKASLLVRFAPEFDKEAKRLSLGGDEE